MYDMRLHMYVLKSIEDRRPETKGKDRRKCKREKTRKLNRSLYMWSITPSQALNTLTKCVCDHEPSQ